MTIDVCEIIIGITDYLDDKSAICLLDLVGKYHKYYRLKEYISNGDIHRGCPYIITRVWFDTDVDIKLPDSVVIIYITKRYRRQLSDLPNGLESITFDRASVYNQVLPKLPDTLKYLKFGYKYNQPIEHLPKSLWALIFGCKYNKPLPTLSQSLQLLTFGTWYNQPLPELPNGLTHLIFPKDSHYWHLLDDVPQSLTKLVLGDRYLNIHDSFRRSLFYSYSFSL
jgi:hypothetical protein